MRRDRRRGLPVVTPAERARFTRLQAFEDAIAYRTARLAAPCPYCRTARHEGHTADADLIATYQQAAKL